MKVLQRFRRGPADPAADPGREHVVTLQGGERYRVRRVRPPDEPGLVTLLEQLDIEEIRLRFFIPLRHFPHRLVGPLVEADDRRFGLVAEPADGPAGFVGTAMLVAVPDNAEAEFAVLVHHDHTRHGLGRYLLEVLLAFARARGIGKVHGLVLRENSAMLEVATELGFSQRPDPEEPGCVRVELDTAG